MNLSWKNVTRHECENIESWLAKDERITEFATDSIVGEYDHYANPNQDGYILGFDVWLKVVIREDSIVAFLVISKAKDSDILAINPIVVNPAFQNRGIGSGKSITQKKLRDLYRQ